jgi:hypothetical protein
MPQETSPGSGVYRTKPGPGYILEQGIGWIKDPRGGVKNLPLRVGEEPEAELLTPEKKAAEAAEKAKLKGAPMPKQADYPDIKDFAEAMRKWREQNRTAKDAAGALGSKPPKK